MTKLIKSNTPMACPCCGKPTSVLSIDMVIDRLGLSPMQSRILRAVWDGGGYPIPQVRIYDAMYEDDPDGGPSDFTAYNALKVALCFLRKKLEGSGIEIETIKRRGYRLKIIEV